MIMKTSDHEDPTPLGNLHTQQYQYHHQVDCILSKWNPTGGKREGREEGEEGRGRERIIIMILLSDIL